MRYQLAATAVAILHLLFILFVAFGGLAVLRRRRLAWLHLPAALWGALIEIGQWDCPLTSAENALLRRAGEAGYDQGFIARHVFGVIYPGGLTRGVELALAAAVVIINVSIYRKVFH